MSQAELKTLARITKGGWKALATLDDPDDADSVRDVLVKLLEALDAIEDQNAD